MFIYVSWIGYGSIAEHLHTIATSMYYRSQAMVQTRNIFILSQLICTIVARLWFYRGTSLYYRNQHVLSQLGYGSILRNIFMLSQLACTIAARLWFYRGTSLCYRKYHVLSQLGYGSIAEHLYAIATIMYYRSQAMVLSRNIFILSQLACTIVARLWFYRGISLCYRN